MKEFKQYNAKWLYEIIYYTQARYKDKIDALQSSIEKCLVQLCKEENIELLQIQIEVDRTSLVIGSHTQIHIQKTLKLINKKLKKHLNEQDIWEQEYVLITKNNNTSEKDTRLEQFVNSARRIGHYDIEQSFRDMPEAFKAYLGTRELVTIDIGNEFYIIDIEAIQKKINLNCKECTKVFKYGCCSGSPCDYSKKNKRNFDYHYMGIAQEIQRFNPKGYEGIMAEGELVSEIGRVREYKGYCALLVDDQGWRKCIVHSYAIDKGIPIYELCPLSCLMYPLEVIELVTDKEKDIRLITSVVDPKFAKAYGRWGDYKCMDVDMRCLDPEHTNHFKKEDYRPVYQVNKELLKYEFGDKLYDGIEYIVQNT